MRAVLLALLLPALSAAESGTVNQNTPTATKPTYVILLGTAPVAMTPSPSTSTVMGPNGQTLATSAAQTTAQTTLSSILAALQAVLSVTFTNTTIGVTGTFWQSIQPISASTLPLPSNAASETGGNLATIAAKDFATAAKQTTAQTSLSSLDLGLAANTTTLMVIKSTLDSMKVDVDKIPTSPSTDRTTAAAPFSLRLSDGAAFYKALVAGDGVIATLAAETTKVIGTINIASGQSVALAAGSQTIGKVDQGAIGTTAWLMQFLTSATVNAAQLGTWTVQQGNTAGSTPWAVQFVTSHTVNSAQLGTWWDHIVSSGDYMNPWATMLSSGPGGQNVMVSTTHATNIANPFYLGVQEPKYINRQRIVFSTSNMTMTTTMGASTFNYILNGVLTANASYYTVPAGKTLALMQFNIGMLNLAPGAAAVSSATLFFSEGTAPVDLAPFTIYQSTAGPAGGALPVPINDGYEIPAGQQVQFRQRAASANWKMDFSAWGYLY